MIRLSKYIGLYILENKCELEPLLDKIDKTKEKMPDYDWLKEVISTDIMEIFYRHLNTDIMIIDSLLHHLHLNDATLRERTYILVAYYKNKNIIFFTGLMSPSIDCEILDQVKEILNESNLILDNLGIYMTSDTNNKFNANEAIYISFLSIEDEIDRIKIHKLLEIFPNGYVEEKL